MSFDAADRWVERWIPAWIHAGADWKSWLWHAAIVLMFGAALAWAVDVPRVWGWRLMVLVYAWREARNVRDRRRLRQRLKPVDHVLDVAFPWAVAEALHRWVP